MAKIGTSQNPYILLVDSIAVTKIARDRITQKICYFATYSLSILGTLACFNRSIYRKFHLGLTLVFTILNFAHLIADLMVQPIAWYQITLMVFLLAIGLLLNIVSFQWMRGRSTHGQYREQVMS